MSAALASPASDLERFLDVVWRPGDVREVRIIANRRRTDSGYFDDPGKLRAAVARYDGRENVYITINPVAPALLARAANRFVEFAQSTTADVDIVERRWLPIDLDPKRPSGISATEVEREHALATARAIYAYLNELAWPDPVTAMSGNGYWLLYPIELANDDRGKSLVEGVLGHLAERFGSAVVSIDTTVANAARIVALIGTMKMKGDPTIERPHRRSALSFVPESPVPVPPERLAALARPLRITVTGRPLVQVGRMPAGWVKKMLDDAGVAFRDTERKGWRWYLLDRCPFHPDDDQGGDCGVSEGPDGIAGGKCFHNRGEGKGWQEFRSALGLESNVIPMPTVVRPATNIPEPTIGMDAADLLALDLPPLRWVVPELIPEGTTILAAPPKIGKSCLVYQIAVEASIGGDLLGRRVTPGSVLYLALEDGKRRGQDRLRAVLAGRTMPRGRLEVRWSAPPIGQGLEEEIVAWLEDHPDAVMVAIDTLGKVRPVTNGRRSAYDVDYEHMQRLQGLFRDRPVALVIVHHSSKEKRDDFLAQVSGTFGITGAADTTVLLRRKRAEQFGEIDVTGRDVADATFPVRFDGLLWLTADPSVDESTFTQREVLELLETKGPLWPKAIADGLGIERTAAQNRVNRLVALGRVGKTSHGYMVAGVKLGFLAKPLSSLRDSSDSDDYDSRSGSGVISHSDVGGHAPLRTVAPLPAREGHCPACLRTLPLDTVGAIRPHYPDGDLSMSRWGVDPCPGSASRPTPGPAQEGPTAS